MSNADTTSRRRFLKLASSVVGAGVIADSLMRVAHAEDLPHLAESDPTATALGYKEDAGKVDGAKYAQHKAGQTCANCKFFQGTAAYGPCQLFPGKSVNAKGWCSAYAVKA